MFDVGRAFAMLWGGLVVVRTRTWVAALPLGLTAYLFALGVASGITVRTEGAQEPMMAMLLVIVGPTSMPRGRLPRLPLASLATNWPLLANFVGVAVLVLAARRLAAREAALPAFSSQNARLGRVVLALWMVAGFEGLSAGTRAVMSLLAHV
jgi:hypothetical protein